MKPDPVDLDDYQDLVVKYHNESDRSAAVLAGSFLEHFLASILKHVLRKEPEVDELFHGFGPFSSFSQRISVAYAFGLIEKKTQDNLKAIKDIRNYFAHTPRDVSFDDKALDKLFDRLSISKSPAYNPEGNGPPKDRRLIYLFTIGMFTMQAHNWMNRTSMQKNPVKEPQ